MLIQVSELLGFQVKSYDINIGVLKDILFDDKKRKIEYLDVDTSGWFLGRRIAFNTTDILEILWSQECIELIVTEKQIEEAPGIDEHPPVSRQWSNAINRYRWPQYAMGSALSYHILNDVDLWDSNFTDEDSVKEKYNPHLRSLYEIIGYDIEVKDGKFGSVRDLIIDSETLSLRYLSLYSRRWLPGSTHYVPIPIISHFDVSEGKVSLNTSKEKVLTSPAMDTSRFVSKRAEEFIHSHYAIPTYWSYESLPEQLSFETAI